MRHLIACLLPLSLLAAPALAQEGEGPALSLEHRMLLRCSATFALVAGQQGDSDSQVTADAAFAERGREFFVRSSAQVMDEAGLDRQQIADALRAEADEIRQSDNLEALLPVCMNVLAQSGL